MELKVERIYLGEQYTIGHLYINGVYFCDTLEDKVRVLNSEKDKIKKETAIPTGRYRVILSYSNHFKCIMPELLDVPYFVGIRIHWGNTKDHTEGCILVGFNTAKGKVLQSKETYKKLFTILNNAFSVQEDIWITVINKNKL